MNRRQFISSSGIAAAALTGSALAPKSGSSQTGRVAPTQAKRALMKLGGTARCDDASLKAALRWGIKNIVTSAEIADGRLYATVDELKRIHDVADRNGITIEILTPPNLSSSHIDREKNPAIMMGEGPQRDRDIEAVQTMIKNCAAAGIPGIKYNMSILGVLRTGRTPGRGDTTYTYFKLANAKADPATTRAGRVTEDRYWERITYFLERVIPVANEYKVRMACHPNDSMTPPEGYQGVNAVLSTVDGLKKFVSIKESPYHGLNFCQGSVAEMLMDPGKEVYDVIRYFGSRKKIFMVHFRNIIGNRLEFAESFVDDGAVNMAEAMRVYKEVGYDGIICPDHAPQITAAAVEAPAGSRGARGEAGPARTGGNEVQAFQYGYIRALIQAADLMGPAA